MENHPNWRTPWFFRGQGSTTNQESNHSLIRLVQLNKTSQSKSPMDFWGIGSEALLNHLNMKKNRSDDGSTTIKVVISPDIWDIMGIW